MHRVLVLDGDTTSAQLLQFVLKNEGYHVDICGSAAEAESQMSTSHYDILLLEMVLMDGDGVEWCQALRRHNNIPLIFVTTRGDVKDRVAGLRAGADDYIIKPFEPAEVLARVWTTLRRGHRVAQTEGLLRTFDLSLDPLVNRVTIVRTGKAVPLTPTECRLLRALITNPGRSMTRDALMIRVWGYEFETENNQLDVYIARLRTKLEQNPHQPKLLTTVRGVGYKYQPSDIGDERSANGQSFLSRPVEARRGAR